MTPITIAAMVERMALKTGNRPQAQRQLSEALQMLGWPVKEAYTPPEVMRIAVTMGRALEAPAAALPPSRERQLLLDVMPALDALDDFVLTGRM